MACNSLPRCHRTCSECHSSSHDLLEAKMMIMFTFRSFSTNQNSTSRKRNRISLNSRTMMLFRAYRFIINVTYIFSVILSKVRKISCINMKCICYIFAPLAPVFNPIKPHFVLIITPIPPRKYYENATYETQPYSYPVTHPARSNKWNIDFLP